MTESRAGWSTSDSSEVARDAGESESFIAAPEHERYEIHDRIGQGGMGTVFAAFDRRLGREVALKHVSLVASSPDAQERLAQEAQITAWLEHPNIVPVYDAGVGEEGAHFYTMRLVRGRSFHDAIEDSRGKTDERTLHAMLRHYLAACQAVAFAHSRGVVHRDLTPSNIMVGAFGETQVVDWGLAARTGADELPVVGTPGYMSPDETATTGGDVWSLGSILKDVLAPRGTPLDHVKDVAPSELFAVLRGCLCADPAQRFADAGALAEEIEHYLDGRRIASHEYSVTELVGRAWKAWRVQIVAVGIALFAVVVVSAFAWQGLRAQRDRATVAEKETQVALRESLQQQAVALLADGDAQASEAVALRAMQIEETAAMRGVLTDLHSRPRPTLQARHTLPECEKVEPVGAEWIVCWGGATLVAYHVPTGEKRWSIDSVATEVRGLPTAIAVLDASAVLTIRSIENGNALSQQEKHSRFGGIQRDHAGTWLATSSGRFVKLVSAEPPYQHRQIRLCGEELVAALGLGREWAVVACRSGDLLRARVGEWTFEHFGTVPISSAPVPLVSIAMSKDDQLVALSNSNGEAVLMGLDGTTLSVRTKVARGLTTLQFVEKNVLANAAGGRPSLWDLSGRTKLLDFPGSAAVYLRSEKTLVSIAGTVHRQWSLPDPIAGHAFHAEAGLAAATNSDSFVAGAGADGTVTIWTDNGNLLRKLPVGPGVVKRAVFSPDGRKLAVAHGGEEGLLVFDTRTWSQLPSPKFPGGLRGVGWRGEELVVAPYRDRVHFVRGQDTEAAGPPDVMDLSVGRRGGVAVLARDGVVSWCEGSARAFRRVAVRPGATIVSALDEGRQVATVVGKKVELHHLETGESVAFHARSTRPTDAVSSEDGRFLFLAAVDGDIEVWTTTNPTLVARWHGHSARISHLSTRHGALLSAGWDGLAKHWSLAPLDFELEQFERATKAAWDL